MWKRVQIYEVDRKYVNYPVCDGSGYIKPTVVLFGESLPFGILDSAKNACKNCDCFIMVGSSLLISPANFLPSIVKQFGAMLIFIKREKTIMDDLADVFLKRLAGEIFTELMKKEFSIAK